MNHPKEYSRNPLRKIRRGMWKRFCGEVLDMTTSLHPRAKPQKTFWKLARGVEYFSRRVVSGDMISTDTFIFTCIYTTCCIAHKKKVRYGLQRQILLKPGFGQCQPLRIPSGHSTLCALSLAPCSPLKPPNGSPRPEELNQVMT